MSPPPATAAASTAGTLDVGLQEWAVCCRALLDGSLCLVVRKGGVHERGGGLFAPEHARFALLPTFLHQAADRLLPRFAGPYLDAVATDPAPGRIGVAGWAEVAAVWKVVDARRLERLADESLWTADELLRRFAYRDQPWLHVLALRVHALPAPQDLADHPAYAGCRSWIPLREPVVLGGSKPVLEPAVFERRVAVLDQALRP